MTTEIPIWVDGTVQWLSGADRRTTCRDVLELFVEGAGGGDDVNNFALVERWREVERPLDLNSRLLKIWSHWGDEQKDVKLCLRRIDNEPDSGRGSPEGLAASLRRRRTKGKTAGKPPWNSKEGLHPRRLAELGGFDRDAYQEYEMRRVEHEDAIYAYGEKTYGRTQEADVRKKSLHKHCTETGALHSTVMEGKSKKCCSKRTGKHKVRNSENIEKLMKLILAQGATIHSQLQRLKEREEQIDNIEVERHKQRAERNGRNYLLETYFESLKDAEVPGTDEEKGNDSGVHTEAGSEQTTSGCDKDKDSVPLHQCDPTGDSKQVQRTSRKDIPRHSEISDSVIPQRSKSESRSSDLECKPSLKRTQSDQAIPDPVEPEKLEETKEDEIVELRRVQSQVELWEKVLRINKKLEKEEENLVKLHIQIRRIQSENIKLAKDHNQSDPQTLSLQKHLESLRSDLDQNSKEIYRNFTQLIEDDEKVVQKRTNLTDLMTDLDKTDREHQFLSEMLAAAASSTPIQNDNIGISLQVKGQEIIAQPDLIPTIPIPDCVETEDKNDRENQRTDGDVMKPKMLKISFDENVHNSTESPPCGEPKNPSPMPNRNLKSILKNRTPDTIFIGDFEKNPVSYGSNISPLEIDQKLNPKPVTIQEPIGVYAHPVNTYNNPIYGQFLSHPFSEQRREEVYGHVAGYSVRREPMYHPSCPPLTSMVIPRDVKLHHLQETAGPQVGHSDIYGQRVSPTSSNGYASAALVTTKAVVHNDTDSSGSSDTSGLSSMYSGSPTVEEPTYVLNTLV